MLFMESALYPLSSSAFCGADILADIAFDPHE